MEINIICEELDDAKAEIERLRSDLKWKIEQCENLRKAQEDKVAQSKALNFRIEKQTAEIFEKCEELSKVKYSCDTLQRNLGEKESTIRHLSSKIELLRADCVERSQKWEDEKKGLLLALDEANETTGVQEITIRSLKEENESLGRLLSESKKKYLKVERNSETRNNIEEGFYALEEQTNKLEDQLKWKKEQFKHLEEAHAKLRKEFQDSKNEWEHEISTLIDKVCSLEESLVSQSRVAEDRLKHLQLCNQALAHEESRRKYLEIELLEFRSRFENVFTQYTDTKSEFDDFSASRNEEIAALRSSLSQKDLLLRESHYRAGKLEHENQDLLESLRELQEAQIKEISKRRKSKHGERMQKSSFLDCSVQDNEINSLPDGLDMELEGYKSTVERKEHIIENLEMELEACYSELLKMKFQNEESVLMLIVIRSGIHDMVVKPENLPAQEVRFLESLEQREVHQDREIEIADVVLDALQNENELKSTISNLNDSLNTANSELALERANSQLLSRRIETLETVGIRGQQMQMELELLSLSLDEFYLCQSETELQALHIESVLKQHLLEAKDKLASTSSELTECRAKSATLFNKLESFVFLEDQYTVVLEEFRKCKEELSQCKEGLEESIKKQQFLGDNLRKACDALDAAHFNLDDERKKTAFLSSRCEAFDEYKDMQVTLKNEMEIWRERCKELSSSCQCHSEEQAAEQESEHTRNIEELRGQLHAVSERLESEMWDRRLERFELWLWKFIVERLNYELGENKVRREGLEASLITQIEVGESFRRDKEDLATKLEASENETLELRRKMSLYEHELETVQSLKLHLASCEAERDEFLLTVQNSDETMEFLNKEIESLFEGLQTKELQVWLLAAMLKEGTSIHEESLIKIVKEKDREISELSLLVASLEEQNKSCLIACSQELALKDSEILLIRESYGNLAVNVTLAQLEIEEKNLVLAELEDEVLSMHHAIASEKEFMIFVNEKASKFVSDLEANNLKLLGLADILLAKLRLSKVSVDEAKIENEHLIHKLSAERDVLMNVLKTFGNKMNELSDEDAQLQETLANIIQNFADDNPSTVESCGELVDDKENHDSCPFMEKNLGVIVEERLPFRQLNKI